MLIDRHQSCLLIIDVQDKLINAVYDYRRVIDNCVWLSRIAQQLDIPLLASEQYPQGLGHTTEALSKHIPTAAFMEKISFSCFNSEACKKRIESLNKDHIIIAGIETHVCVLQTAMQLIAVGKQVYVVRDATSSRSPEDRRAAFCRMSANKIQLVTREMVAFEWLKQAGTAEFKAISEGFLKQ